MNRIRVVIADDEPLARRGIRQLLISHADVDVVGEARHGREAVRMLNALTPDLVFLDVQMPELDAFGVLRELNPEHMPAVVFVTAYETFAVRAFDLHALDYLVKPVQEQRFHEAVARARMRIRSGEAMALAQRLSELLAGADGAANRAASAGRRLVIGTRDGDLVVDVADITWIEAEDYYAAVHVGGQRQLVRESLTSLERRLDPSYFIRVHRSAVVNLAHVREYRTPAAGDTAIVLRDGHELAVSRRRRPALAEALRRLGQGHRSLHAGDRSPQK
jgi:two-component system, LytTR family, response regulator